LEFIIKSSCCLRRNNFFLNNRSNSITSSNLLDVDALVLGAYKDGSLSETASKELPEKVRKSITQLLQCSGSKGKLGEARFIYGIEGFPSKIAVIGLGNKPKNLKDSLEKARVAVKFNLSFVT
jgi:hypothetical protein